MIFVDSRDIISPEANPEAYSEDLVHPSPEGGRMIGNYVAEQILLCLGIMQGKMQDRMVLDRFCRICGRKLSFSICASLLQMRTNIAVEASTKRTRTKREREGGLILEILIVA